MSEAAQRCLPASTPADAGDGLTTARLQLRRYTLADLPELTALNGNAEVMRHLGGPMSAEQTRTMLEGRVLRYYDDHPGLGAWATIERASGRCIGFHLLNHVQGETQIQVGYRLLPEFWGRGFATEMSIGLLHYGFVQLGQPVLTAIADLANEASQRVLLKSGLLRMGERAYTHPSYSAFGPLAYFERDAASWLAWFARDHNDTAGVGSR